MPQHLVLHEGDSAPLHGVGDDAGGSVVRAFRERAAKRIMIVAVDPQCVPAKRAPLGAEWLEIHGVGHPS